MNDITPMDRKNIVLIGMPGAYKTTVGKAFGFRAGMLPVDTDQFIEYEVACSIAEIFKRCGEEYFRKLESNVIRRLVDMENAVMSVGGGGVLLAENRKIMRKHAYVVWLEVSPVTVYERLYASSEKRPLLMPLSLDKIENMYKERKKIYTSAAHARLVTDGKTAEEVTSELCELIMNKAFGAY